MKNNNILKLLILAAFGLTPTIALANDDLTSRNQLELLNLTSSYLKMKDVKTGATQSRILRTSYMRKNCKDLADSDLSKYGVQDWKSYPLEICQYQVKDSAGKRLTKTSSVILLKISDSIMSQWMTNTCMEINKPNLNCIKILTQQIITQSGGQYPVRGIVYEDILKYHADYKKKIYAADGFYEPFCFRDGLTVMLDTFRRNSIELLTEQQKQSCFIGPLSQDAEKVGLYARINGTSSLDYQKRSNENFKVIHTVGGAILSTENWLTISRTETQAAIRTGANRLMTIWAWSNLGKFK